MTDQEHIQYLLYFYRDSEETVESLEEKMYHRLRWPDKTFVVNPEKDEVLNLEYDDNDNPITKQQRFRFLKQQLDILLECNIHDNHETIKEAWTFARDFLVTILRLRFKNGDNLRTLPN